MWAHDKKIMILAVFLLGMGLARCRFDPVAKVGQSRGLCGNGVLDPGEECDDGNQDNSDACPDDAAHGGTCQAASCGDGFVWAGQEVCDDGNQVSGDGCSGDCLSDETCGNGVVDVGEACDDGNQVSGDGCSADCLSDETCGNGVVDVGEVCDDGNQVSGDGCSGDCLSDETCGNGITDSAAGEQCDDGNQNPANGIDDFCSSDCHTNSWPCGEWPGFMPARYDSCRYTMHDVRVNGSSTGYAVVTAGTLFATQATMNYQHCDYCPGCIVQAYTGLMAGPAPAADDGTTSGCDYGWQVCDSRLSFGDNDVSGSLLAPDQPGTYYFRFGITLAYHCTSWGCPDHDHDLFAVCVVSP